MGVSGVSAGVSRVPTCLPRVFSVRQRQSLVCVGLPESFSVRVPVGVGWRQKDTQVETNQPPRGKATHVKGPRPGRQQASSLPFLPPRCHFQRHVPTQEGVGLGGRSVALV